MVVELIVGMVGMCVGLYVLLRCNKKVKGGKVERPQPWPDHSQQDVCELPTYPGLPNPFEGKEDGDRIIGKVAHMETPTNVVNPFEKKDDARRKCRGRMPWGGMGGPDSDVADECKESLKNQIGNEYAQQGRTSKIRGITIGKLLTALFFTLLMAVCIYSFVDVVNDCRDHEEWCRQQVRRTDVESVEYLQGGLGVNPKTILRFEDGSTAILRGHWRVME